MNFTLGLGLLLAGFLTVEGLLKPSHSPKHHGAMSRAQEQQGRRAAQELARRNLGFGFNLYKKLAANSPGKNIFFSPVSISTAFAMLCLGAQNTTLAEIKQGLNFQKMPEKDLHGGFHYLIQKLNQKAEGLQLTLENTLFLDQRLRPEKRFMADAKDLYNADSVPTNFQNTEYAQKQINDYVSKQTQGKINNLVKNIDAGTVMLLVNCIFFRARWLHEFDPKATKEGDFFLEENRPVKVPMMFHGGMYAVGYDEQLGCTVLEMPYFNNITATFVLPDKGAMRRAEEALTLDTFDRWKKLVTRRVVDVFLPRFSITGTYDLKKTLSHLGITKVFQEYGDLTRIVPNRSLKVGEATHKAKLRIDEKGSEGAAGTGMQTLPMERPMTFKLDRAFLLMIAENLTPTMLFMGKIANPAGS
ncbi:serpin A12 [Pipistrellus kuhlii]|uniref:Serpin family A member 12 n=1 Tax=Pipistrellus kuhlii TaxID=59472 RepID=A0A7J7RA08_PIPKU|nr:serpin A12 [Pipistrellus kuhlii]KAF6273030.1 serpin family A member 12 [Pipistrellus kuhlii]